MQTCEIYFCFRLETSSSFQSLKFWGIKESALVCISDHRSLREHPQLVRNRSVTPHKDEPVISMLRTTSQVSWWRQENLHLILRERWYQTACALRASKEDSNPPLERNGEVEKPTKPHTERPRERAPMRTWVGDLVRTKRAPSLLCALGWALLQGPCRGWAAERGAQRGGRVPPPPRQRRCRFSRRNQRNQLSGSNLHIYGASCRSPWLLYRQER